MARVFVSGGAGFIGSHLCLKLLKDGHDVKAYDNLLLGKEEFLSECKTFKNFQFIKADLLDIPKLRSEIRGYNLAYHLAANSDISQGTNKTDVDLQIGTIATYNVLEAMRHEGLKEIVFASTSAIYGEATVKPTPENYGPLLPISFYGASKLACEALLSAFAHNCGYKVWIYRFANIVGAHTTHGAIHDFIVRLKKDPSALKVLGNGTQRKSYLHVNDCVEGMIYGYNKSKEDFQFFNLASEGVTQVKFIAETVVKELGKGSNIEYGKEDRGWVGDVAYTWLDGSKYAKLGWKAKHNSDEAVVQAIKDILKEARWH